MTSKNAIITLAIGDAFEEMGKHTHPLMKRYATICNADFIVINKKKYEEKLGLITYEKFQVGEYLGAQYERLLFIDTDVVVCPNAPNLFQLCPPGTFCAANEEGYSMAGTHKKVTQQVLGEIDWKFPYFNSGVMLFDNHHKDIFNPDNQIFRNWISHPDNNDHVMSDQPILNYLINRGPYSFFDLGYKFNRTRVLKDTHNRFKSYFIHYAGPSGHRYGSRINQIKADCKVASSPANFWLSKRLPIFRWVADRACIAFAKYVIYK